MHANFLGGHDLDNWCLHMIIIGMARILLGQLWLSATRLHWLVGRHQVQLKGINFKQVDFQERWDDAILFQMLIATTIRASGTLFKNFPAYDGWGLVILLLLHVGPVEFIYYWYHRLMHNHFLYARFHAYHHISFVTESVSGPIHDFAEQIVLATIFSIPVVGAELLGHFSLTSIYIYSIGFDFLNCIAHSNWEFVPLWLFRAFPPLKYLFMTATFHGLHHSQISTNYALFMPLYDYMGNTVDKLTDEVQEAAFRGREDVPDFVFLSHGSEVLSIFHTPFGIMSFASRPYAPSWLMYILWPLALPVWLLLWLFGEAFVLDKHRLHGLSTQTWLIPRLASQYFQNKERKAINALIEKAIVDSDKMGVKVFTPGLLNQAESLNGGGKLFVSKHPNLRVCVANGSTLTAAYILKQIPPWTKEVALTGATSHVGRAIALYLCKRGICVITVTKSKEAFSGIQAEADEQHRHLLLMAESYTEAAHCKRWIIGQPMTRKEQRLVQPGTHFHQFVFPVMHQTRGDCTYRKVPGMRLPSGVQGLRTCEMSMERGCVHACHAGGLVHALEGWQHHEVGEIDPDRIDIVWEAALRHGMKPTT
eukprot:TRINITY_DN3078_c0_g1_i2.p1 TRINITY_DN3078_c0_g1~~TRINITY_DN3078_c0_g1_i2.p1  ORF type:complete len:640 (-),score=124.51 TRINITY_DN3078_c0_g1_i2:272-2047(-)